MKKEKDEVSLKRLEKIDEELVSLKEKEKENKKDNIIETEKIL